MALYLGLDVGTTTLSIVVLDTATRRLVARNTVPHGADVPSEGDEERGRAELDLGRLGALAVESLAQTAGQVPEREAIRGLGVTGQMHGVAFLHPDATPLGPAITWQDRRALEQIPGSAETYLQRFIYLAGGPSAFERMGCLPAAGYLGPTLYWLHCNGRLPPPPAGACFIPDAIVALLTGQPACTDPTDGGSSGIFDIVSRQWDHALVERLGLPPWLLPEVREPGTRAGTLRPELAASTGLPQDLPVCVALGDNQASFLGSVREPGGSLSINVGTGSQISALMDGYQRLPGLDTRYYPGERYLLVGAALFGGRSYATLREFFRRIGAAFFGARGDEELYEEMNRLAASVPSGADGVCCSPLFAGSRLDPAARASFTGLTPENLAPGHLTRALLESVAEGFYAFYQQMRPVIGERRCLVGSGNGIRRNPLLARILAERFAMPLVIPTMEEEAAVGAALAAAVGNGEFSGFSAAGRIGVSTAPIPHLRSDIGR